MTNITAGVSDGDLPIVFNPALSTENVVDAGRHLIPLIVVSKSRKKEVKNQIYFNLTSVDIALGLTSVCVSVCLSSPEVYDETADTHPGRVT